MYISIAHGKGRGGVMAKHKGGWGDKGSGDRGEREGDKGES